MATTNPPRHQQGIQRMSEMNETQRIYLGTIIREVVTQLRNEQALAPVKHDCAFDDHDRKKIHYLCEGIESPEAAFALGKLGTALSRGFWALCAKVGFLLLASVLGLAAVGVYVLRRTGLL